MADIKRIAAVVIALILAGFQPAFAGSEGGNDAGHGGGTWVCRDASDAIQWVKLVDLFEAKNEYGLSPDSFSDQPIDTQLSKVADKIKAVNPDMLPIYAENLRVLRTTLSISESIDISRIPDAHLKVTPAQELCPGGQIDYEQVANYPDGQNLIIAGILYDKLSVTEQAALLVHEAVYKIYRDEIGATDSDLAREAVGYLFSATPTGDYPVKFFGVPEKNILNRVAALSWRNFPASQASFDIASFFYDFGYSRDFALEVAPMNGWYDPDGDLDTGTVEIKLATGPSPQDLALIANWTDLRTQAVVSLNFAYQCLPLDSELSILQSTETDVNCVLNGKSMAGVQQGTGETNTISYEGDNDMWMMIVVDSSITPQAFYLNQDPPMNGEIGNKFVPVVAGAPFLNLLK